MRAGSLTRARDFERVRAHGRRARSDGIAVTAAPSTEPGAGSKLGLAVGRSAGSAVTRNRIKRRVRAAWRTCMPAVAHDVVVRPDPSVATMPYQDLEVHLKRAVTRATSP
ncbi:MAG TPA: ribonuclease P protein component [Actinomycetota bacterium]|jgi:ribonuclease P protein component